MTASSFTSASSISVILLFCIFLEMALYGRNRFVRFSIFSKESLATILTSDLILPIALKSDKASSAPKG